MNNQVFVNYLQQLFPNAKCELNFNTNLELLISVILSAQCTDKRVNMVTPVLFKKYKTVQDFASANVQEIEQIIKPCGLYKSKAKHIVLCASGILKNYNGQIPNTREQLTKLSGVGRKTANVYLSTIYGENCIAVDTHVLRVSNRLGFAKTKNPLVCEKALTKKFKTDLNVLHHRLVLFGRYYCKAKKPECQTCKLKEYCTHYKQSNK